MEVREANAAYLTQTGSSCPPGYKQTEVGVVPEDWDAPELGGILKSMQLGGNYKNGERETNWPLIKMGNLGRGNIKLYKLEFIDFSQPPAIRDRLKKYDVLFNTRNTLDLVGKIAIWREELPEAYFNSNIMRMEFDESRVSSNRFMNYILNTSQSLNKLRSIAIGTTSVAAIYTRDLVRVRVPLPTKAEQEAIAGALSDTDGLIESLEQLIAKKRHLKQGAMQGLLTGKKRLPGFGGDWNRCQLGKVIYKCSSGATPYRGRPDYYKGTVKWITSGELNYGVIFDTIEHISTEAVEKTNLKVHPTGTFLLAITGLEAAGTRGACGIVGSPAATNQSCMAIYPTSDLGNDFLFHYYVFRGNELALNYCQGTKQQSYTAKLVKLLPIDLPPTTDEQTAIAAILSDMDTEIAALEEKLAKARRIKQGMMQELLTGRIRLV